MYCNKKELLNGLKMIKKSVGIKSDMTVLSYVRVRSQDDVLTVHGTNLDNTMTFQMECGALTALDIVVEYKTLIDTLNLISSDFVTFTKTGSTMSPALEIQADNDDFETMKIDALLPVEDFPTLPKMKSDFCEIACFPDDILPAIDFCAPAISRDETRPHINSLLFETDGKLIATDGHRMHISKLPFTLKNDLLLAASTVELMHKILKKAKIETSFCIDREPEGLIRIKCGAYSIYSEQVDAEFPPYDQLIPKSFDGMAEFKTKKIKDFCKKSKNRGLKITINKDVLSVYQKDETRSSNISVNCKSVNAFMPQTDNDKAIDLHKPFEIGFKASYVFDALTKDTQTTIQFNGPIDPAVFGTADQFALVMPMRI